jgi:carbon storage regulator
MLVLSRMRDETIMVGDDIEITIVDIRGDKVRLGITAPRELSIHRREVWVKVKAEAAAADEKERAEGAAASAAR